MAQFVIAPRISGQPAAKNLRRARTRAVAAQFSGFADSAAAEATPELGALIVEGEKQEFESKQAELADDYIVEELKPRRPSLFTAAAASPPGMEQLPSGIGATVELTATCEGTPLSGAMASVSFVAFRGFVTTTFESTDSSGRAVFAYDPQVWIPFTITVVPLSRAWAASSIVTGSSMKMSLPALPKNGPLGWWKRLLGVSGSDAQLGEGIRVGVVDSGVGPHPALAHVKKVGAFLNGAYLSEPDETLDVGQHGSHVTGIIGARPAQGSGGFEGISPGAELVAARIYPGGGKLPEPTGFATNADIANAILALSQDEKCDIINLSSSGPMRSATETDRINAAFDSGTLLICAGGNGGGPPVLFPAAEPNVVSVAGLGMANTIPLGVLDVLTFPTQADRYSVTGLFSANFNSLGFEIKTSAPGVGIISTVPATSTEGAPYVAMSGTSMATPCVAAALAIILSRDPQYRTMPRNRERSIHAWRLLGSKLRPLGLSLPYQGYGMPIV